MMRRVHRQKRRAGILTGVINGPDTAITTEGENRSVEHLWADGTGLAADPHETMDSSSKNTIGNYISP
jgi:hypothetical protein